jgi:hypothetical protein
MSSFLTEDPVPINVCHHHVANAYFFEPKDINLLRASGYTDSQVTMFLTNFTLEFFDHRVRPEAIRLHSIDLCRVVDEDNSLIGLLLEDDRIKCASRLLDTGEPFGGKFSLDLIKDRTAYFNFTSKRTKVLTLAVYRPIDKRNKNRYFDPKAVKFELRFARQAIERKYLFGGEISVVELIKRLKGDTGYLGRTFESTLAHT